MSIPSLAKNGRTEGTLEDKESNLYNIHEIGKGTRASEGNRQKLSKLAQLGEEYPSLIEMDLGWAQRLTYL